MVQHHSFLSLIQILLSGMKAQFLSQDIDPHYAIFQLLSNGFLLLFISRLAVKLKNKTIQ